jgi:hypothetical protein
MATRFLRHHQSPAMNPSTKTVFPTPPLVPAHLPRTSGGTTWARSAWDNQTLS